MLSEEATRSALIVVRNSDTATSPYKGGASPCLYMDTAQNSRPTFAPANRIDDAITALKHSMDKPLGKPAATLDVNQASQRFAADSPAARKKMLLH